MPQRSVPPCATCSRGTGLMSYARGGTLTAAPALRRSSRPHPAAIAAPATATASAAHQARRTSPVAPPPCTKHTLLTVIARVRAGGRGYARVSAVGELLYGAADVVA